LILLTRTHKIKAGEIHDYYIKLEEIIHDAMHEESTELKLQLEQHRKIVEQKTDIWAYNNYRM